MFIPVLALNKLLALLTLVRLRSALLRVHNPLVNLESLLAELARSRLHITALFMVTKLGGRCSELAVLARNRFVSCLFVLLAIGFWDNFSALAALVVIPSAANLVHTHF